MEAEQTPGRQTRAPRRAVFRSIARTLGICVALATAVYLGALAGLYDPLVEPALFVAGAVVLASWRTWQSARAQAALAAERQAALAALQAAQATLERRMSEHEAMQERALAAERLSALGRVAAGMAHEFNNVLAGIMGRLDLLAMDVADPAVRDNIAFIQRAVEDAADVVQRVQGFSRRRLSGSPATLSLRALVQDAVVLTQPRWDTPPRPETARIAVRMEIPDGLTVWGQATELREVLTNLILNAVDALPEGGEIAIGAIGAGDSVEITIHDSGSGVDVAVQERIFEPFFTTKPAGSGLGLALVREIVEAHGGAVRFASRPGQGTTVTVTLAAGEAPGAASIAAPVPLPGTGRILVVDDSPQLADMLRGALAAAGHHVVVALSGREALARLDEHPFDVVCTDLAMPGMDGGEVIRRVRERAPHMRTVLITGWAMAPDSPALAGYLIDYVLSKPFRAAQVQEVIAALLEAQAGAEAPP